MPEITRTMAALIEQVDQRTMKRLKRAWKDDSVPVGRRPAMKRYLLHSDRTSPQNLLPYLRMEQLRAACQSLRTPYGGYREDLVTRVSIEGLVDSFNLKPFSRKAQRVRKFLWEAACSDEPLCPDELLEEANRIAEGEDTCALPTAEPKAEPTPRPRSIPESPLPPKSRSAPSPRSPTKPDSAPRPKPSSKKTRRPTGFAAIGGMDKLKERLQQEVIDPLQHPKKYQRYGLTIPNGILLHGPPGCGKTFLVGRLAEHAGLELVTVLPSLIGSALIHETASRIATLFEEAAEKAPSLLFLDELDAIAPSRAELDGTCEHKAEEVNELLAQLQGAGDRGILVVGATNLKSHLDPALLRAGRFDRHYHIGPPDAPARKAILQLYLANRPTDPELDLQPIITRTANATCADLKLLVDDAARLALRENQPIGAWHLERAASKRRQL
jgi:SpoVK/Ycf46/Vps4 family AAA+-type ATPase